MFLLSVLLVVASSIGVFGQSSGPCSYGEFTGECVTSCINHFVSSAQGSIGCQAFASSVKCCVPFGKCTYNGANGLCTASCNGGTHVASNLANGCEPYSNNVKCCVPSTAATTTTTTSTTTTTTTTSTVATTTPQQATTMSGLPAGPACVAYNRGGSCVKASLCPAPYTSYGSKANVVTGCEPFAADIKCCSPGTPDESSTTASPSGASDRIPQAAVNIIKQFEGFRSKAYPDPITGGKPITIGYGSTRRRDGSVFVLGDVISQDQAIDLLYFKLETEFAKKQEERIPGWFQLNSNQRAAIISFAYNVGAMFYGSNNFRTITNVIRDRQWSKIRAALLLYINKGSSAEAGLRRRREAEAALFLKPITNAAGLMEEPIEQVELTADDDVDFLDPSLHEDNSVAIGLGVTAGIVVLALIIAAVIWVCVGKRAKFHRDTENNGYKSSYTCKHCSAMFDAADELADHVSSKH